MTDWTRLCVWLVCLACGLAAVLSLAYGLLWLAQLWATQPSVRLAFVVFVMAGAWYLYVECALSDEQKQAER